MSFDYHDILFKKWEIWIIYLKLKEIFFWVKNLENLVVRKKGKHNVPQYNLEKYGPPQKEIISIKHTKNIKMIYIYI